MQELIKKIEQWGEEKGLIKPENAPKQYLKFLEEVGEVAKELLKPEIDKEALKLELGDVGVTIILLSKQLGVKQFIRKSDIVLSISYIIEEVNENDIGVYTLDYLSDFCNYHELTLQDCLQSAYDKISKRKGETINGVFVKSVSQ